MAVTSGLFAISAANVAGDILNHLTPASGTVAPAVTVTGPIKMKLLTTTSTNTAEGTECADANYTAGGQPITAWNAAATTAGAGYNVGYVGKTNQTVLDFPQGNTSTGFAAAAALAGVSLVSSDATPVKVAYLNFAATVNVPQGNVYQWGNGAFTFAQS